MVLVVSIFDLTSPNIVRWPVPWLDGQADPALCTVALMFKVCVREPFENA
jgi:hypothetical protein